MALKEFKVRFYRVSTQSADEDDQLTPPMLFANLHRHAGRDGLCPAVNVDTLGYEIRDLVSHNRGAVYQGVFATIRDDAPHIREAQGGERIIPLADDEGILEKNHFIYYSNQSVLVYQVNMRASHPTRFEDYLRTMAGAAHTVSLDDMLTRDAWERLRDGVVKQFDVMFDAPNDPRAYDPTDFSAENMAMMERAGAGRISLTQKATRGHQGMGQWVKRTARQLSRDAQVRKLKVRLDGDETPIDLIADVIREKMTVEMDGRYPNSRRTFEELEAAKRRAQGAIDAHFGN